MLVIGAGLAGSLVALALAERGATVELLDPCTGSGATGFSYGGVPWWAGAPGPMNQLMASAPAAWKRLESRHGPLGWRPCSLRLYWSQDDGASSVDRALAQVDTLVRRHLAADQVERLGASPVSGVAGALRVDYGRVDGHALALALPVALQRAGVHWRRERCAPLRPGALPAGQVVLAAGSGCRALWPGLADRLRVSWAGVLLLEDPRLTRELLGACSLMPANDILMPLLAERMALEQRAEQLRQPAWIIDAGLAPWGEGLLLGQSSLIRPGTACGAPPEAAPLEQRLRRSLGRVDPRLAKVPACFQQVPVSFTGRGPPLVGPVPEVAGLWVFAGLSSPFALAPPLAELLADALGGDPRAVARLPGASDDAGSNWG